MDSKPVTADTETNELYKHMRQKYGEGNSRANGYICQRFFLNEQKIVLSEVDANFQTVIDIGCGSGLMLKPLIGRIKSVIGFDFNEIACADARLNGLPVIRADAFRLPLPDNSVQMALNCQFLNQQPTNNAQDLVKEMNRVLCKGGRCLLVWRNHRAAIHQLALLLFNSWHRIVGNPRFPHYDNPVNVIEQMLIGSGFSKIVKKELIFPLINWRTSNVDGLAGKLIGASCFIVAEK